MEPNVGLLTNTPVAQARALAEHDPPAQPAAILVVEMAQIGVDREPGCAIELQAEACGHLLATLGCDVLLCWLNVE